MLGYLFNRRLRRCEHHARGEVLSVNRNATA